MGMLLMPRPVHQGPQAEGSGSWRLERVNELVAGPVGQARPSRGGTRASQRSHFPGISVTPQAIGNHGTLHLHPHPWERGWIRRSLG